MSNPELQPETYTTTIQCLVPQGMFFPWLPPQGQFLNFEEIVTVKGDLLSGGLVYNNRYNGRQYLNDVVNCVKDGFVKLINTPSPILQDATNTDESFTVAVDGGALAAVESTFVPTEEPVVEPAP